MPKPTAEYLDARAGDGMTTETQPRKEATMTTAVITEKQREMKRERDRRYRDRKKIKTYVLGSPKGPQVVDEFGHQMGLEILMENGEKRFATPKEAAKFQQDQEREVRERKAAGPSISERYGADWLGAIRKEVKTRIRTEVGLEHRLRAQAEIDALTADVTMRLDDCASLGSMPELASIADIREFARVTRKELFAWAGTKDVSGVVEY